MLIELSYNLCFQVLSLAAPSSVATRHTENKVSSALAAPKVLILTSSTFVTTRHTENKFSSALAAPNIYLKQKAALLPTGERGEGLLLLKE